MNNFMPDSVKSRYTAAAAAGVRLDSESTPIRVRSLRRTTTPVGLQTTTYGLNHAAAVPEDAPRPSGIPYPRRQD